ncbi:MAG TPA: 6-phosphogluconolactonase [Steroidobacteraceae bacterium]|nr:6-phosphogluconolactonase [Steroidobacteraceae bacterium]
MRLIVAQDAEEAARCAAGELARACAAALAERRNACIALSGGRSPRRAFEHFAAAPLPWTSIVVAQVDERCVAAADPRRNLATLQATLVDAGSLPRDNLLAMPVERDDLERAADDYGALLAGRLGAEGRLDIVQLGLGDDGHTASLVPHDPVLEVVDRDVATTRPYQGTRRMTLTYRVLQRSRERLWLVTGPTKARALAELLDGTGTSPAVRVAREHSVVVADRAAAPGEVGTTPA